MQDRVLRDGDLRENGFGQHDALREQHGPMLQRDVLYGMLGRDLSPGDCSDAMWNRRCELYVVCGYQSLYGGFVYIGGLQPFVLDWGRVMPQWQVLRGELLHGLLDWEQLRSRDEPGRLWRGRRVLQRL